MLRRRGTAGGRKKQGRAGGMGKRVEAGQGLGRSRGRVSLTTHEDGTNDWEHMNIYELESHRVH